MSISISSKMKFLVVLCFVATVAQAINLDDVDWTKVEPRDITPPYIPEIQDNENETFFGSGRIVGGEVATLGQFPNQVGLILTSSDRTSFCGGSILNEKWVLTAAHCVDDDPTVTILFAAQNIVDRNPELFTLDAARKIVHESWDPYTLMDDIALLEIPEALTFSDFVQPILLPSRSQANNTFAGSTGIVSGWGRDDSPSRGVSPVLRWTSNPILTNIECNGFFTGIVSNSQICLSGVRGRSSCHGDSGGPLIALDTKEEVIQVGVVSYGTYFGCDVEWPSVYTRTSSYLDWIGTNTGGSVVIRD